MLAYLNTASFMFRKNASRCFACSLSFFARKGLLSFTYSRDPHLQAEALERLLTGGYLVGNRLS